MKGRTLRSRAEKAAVVPIPQEGDLVLDGVSVGSDGRLKATVTPPADAGDAYFMRLKVK